MESVEVLEGTFPMEIWYQFVEILPQLYGVVSGLSKQHYEIMRRDLEYFKLATCVLITDSFGHCCGVLPNGKKHGRSRRTYFGGAIRDELDFVDGEIHGKWVDYYGDGRVEKIETWEEGVKNGEYTRYWPSGAIKTRGWQINDTHHGQWFGYDEMGTITWNYDYCQDGCDHGVEN